MLPLASNARALELVLRSPIGNLRLRVWRPRPRSTLRSQPRKRCPSGPSSRAPRSPPAHSINDHPRSKTACSAAAGPSVAFAGPPLGHAGCSGALLQVIRRPPRFSSLLCRLSPVPPRAPPPAPPPRTPRGMISLVLAWGLLRDAVWDPLFQLVLAARGSLSLRLSRLVILLVRRAASGSRGDTGQHGKHTR